MGGGLLQLVSTGKQGIHLTGNPVISYFKQVYKRHTNFSIESIPLQFNQDVDFGTKSVCDIDVSSTSGTLFSDFATT